MNISDSVQLLLSSQQRIVEQFYDRFLTRHPELQHHFESRDLERQASMVTMALVMVEANYSHHYPATEHYLKVLGNRHFHNGIRRDDFPKFRDVMLDTLQDFHAVDWDEKLHQEWRAAIDLAINVMLEGYSANYTF